MRKLSIITGSLLIAFLATSCALLGIKIKGKPMQGKVAEFDFDRRVNGYRLYGDNSAAHHIMQLHPGPDASWTYVSWVHKEDKFIGAIASENSKKPVAPAIVQYKLDGHVEKTICALDPDESASQPFLSGDDSKMIFLSFHKRPDNLNNKGVYRRQLIVAGYAKGERIIKLECEEPSSTILAPYESPWIAGHDQFIYVVQPYTVNEAHDTNLAGAAKLYLYDIASGSSKLLFEHDYKTTCLFTCSPVENKIAFSADNMIWVYDLDTQEKKMIFTGKRDTIDALHWTPDGKSLYYNHTSLFATSSGLIDATHGNPIQSGYPAMSVFTWK